MCLFTKGRILLAIYVNDVILISLTQKGIYSEIKSLKHDFILTDDGMLKDGLETQFNALLDRSVELTQPKMVERALQAIGF